MSPNVPLNGFIQRFGRAKILVVGDLMLDEFVWGKVSRISPEAPVPVVWVQSESVMPGGAANVANNIRSLGGQVAVVGVVGEDRWGVSLLADLASRKDCSAESMRYRSTLIDEDSGGFAVRQRCSKGAFIPTPS